MRNSYYLNKREKQRKREEARKNRSVKKVFKKLLFIIGILIVIVLVAAISTFFVFRAVGKQQLKSDTVGDIPDAIQLVSGDSAEDEEDEGLKPGQTRYDGKVYQFNEDMLTFLIMGTDTTTKNTESLGKGYDGGQADLLLLMTLNPHSKKVKAIAIDRNTMASVDIYDENGSYVRTDTTQICIAHGFGDGKEESCEHQEKAVSNFLRGIPINGYCAVDLSAIPAINDSVGGVKLTIAQDMTKWDKSLYKGAEITLTGKQALIYTRQRDEASFGSADARLERQRQYLKAFIIQAKESFKKDPTYAMRLYSDLSDYMVTDLTAQKVTYLAGMASGYDLGSGEVTKVSGNNVMGKEYEEFYTDEDDLTKLIIDTYYEPVE